MCGCVVLTLLQVLTWLSGQPIPGLPNKLIALYPYGFRSSCRERLYRSGLSAAHFLKGSALRPSQLCLIGRPSAQRFTANFVRAYLHRERGFAIRDSIAFIRSLRRVRLAVPRVVTMPSVMASSVVR